MRLIIVDGLDAVGKDTQGKMIADYYKKKGEKVILRTHPSEDNYFGRKAKKSLFQEDKIGKIKASIFYMLDVLRSIRIYYNPKQKSTLIMVRYLMGTAYLPKKIVKFGYNFFENFVPTSKYMFYLDASTEELLRRIQKRNETEIFETHAALEKVRNKATLLIGGWYIINTEKSINETFSDIKKILDRLDKENQEIKI